MQPPATICLESEPRPPPLHVPPYKLKKATSCAYDDNDDGDEPLTALRSKSNGPHQILVDKSLITCFLLFASKRERDEFQRNSLSPQSLMGEEEKKPEEKKMEEKKPEEGKKAEEEKKETKKEEKAAEEKKEDSKEQSPPAPKEIILKVFMHCEGCARKVRRCLKGFEGVEDVETDCKGGKVVVKGEKADPLKVLERVQRKSHRQVLLLSPIPKPPAEEEKKAEEKEQPKPEEKKEEPQVITVVLKVHMHCEACAQVIKKRIQRMKGVESAEPDLKGSQVTVKGVFDPAKLVEYVHKKTGKQAAVVKQEPEKKEEEKGKEEKKGEEGGGGDEKEKKSGGDEDQNKEKKEGEGKGEGESKQEAVTEESKVVEMKINEYCYYPTKYDMEWYESYPSQQIFSDENPNACSVM